MYRYFTLSPVDNRPCRYHILYQHQKIIERNTLHTHIHTQSRHINFRPTSELEREVE